MDTYVFFECVLKLLKHQTYVDQIFGFFHSHICWYIYILVGGWPTPLKNVSSSMGRMTSHIWNGKLKMFQTTNEYVYTWLPKGQCFFGIINPYLGCFSWIWVGLCQAMDWRVREHVRLKLARISTFSYLQMFLSCICKNMMYPKCRIKVLMFCLQTPFTGSH